MTPHIAMASGGEFDLVRRMLAVWGDLATGVGDDAAILDVPAAQRLVVSTDTSIERTHFVRDWLSREEIAWRAATAAISDLAATAARPLGMLVALTLSDDDVPRVEELATGLGEAARAAGASILGGDITRGDTLSLTVTVLGSTAVPIRRDGARPGDRLYVTGVLGGPARAVRAWQQGQAPSAWARQRFARPRARIEEAEWLARHGASAMIDISDGLASELRHMAAASQVELRVDVRRFPAGDGGDWRDAAGGGEEYELLVAMRDDADVATFVRTFGVPLTLIGVARASDGGRVVARDGEVRVDLPMGHDHFSR